MAVKKSSAGGAGRAGKGAARSRAKRLMQLLSLGREERVSGALKTQRTPKTPDKTEMPGKTGSRDQAGAGQDGGGKAVSLGRAKASTATKAGISSGTSGSKAPESGAAGLATSGARKPSAKGRAKPGVKSKPDGIPRGRDMAQGRRRNQSSAGLQRGADNAAHIQQVALDLFAKHSFSAVTIKDIGQAAGLNTAMIYYYFRDKEDLFRSTVEVAVRNAIEAFEAHRGDRSDAAAVISDWLELQIEQFDQIRKFVKVSIDYASSANRIARVDKAIHDFYDHEKAILREAILQGIGNRQFPARDPGPLVDRISIYLDGVMIRSFILPEFDAASAIRRFKAFALALLRREPVEVAPSDLLG